MRPNTAEQAVKLTGNDACDDKVKKLYIASQEEEDKGVFNSGVRELGAPILFLGAFNRKSNFEVNERSFL